MCASEREMRAHPDSWASMALVMSLVMPLPVECPPGRQMPPLISTATCASGQAKSARKAAGLRDRSPSCFWYEAQVAHTGRVNSRWKGRPGKETSHWLAKASSRWLGIGGLGAIRDREGANPNQHRAGDRVRGIACNEREPVGMAKGHHPQQRLDGFRHGLLKLVVAGAEGGLDDP